MNSGSVKRGDVVKLKSGKFAQVISRITEQGGPLRIRLLEEYQFLECSLEDFEEVIPRPEPDFQVDDVIVSPDILGLYRAEVLEAIPIPTVVEGAIVFVLEVFVPRSGRKHELPIDSCRVIHRKNHPTAAAF